MKPLGGEKGDTDTRTELVRKFTWMLAVAATILAALPVLIGFGSNPPGGLYLGAQFNVDDHMVYGAWMHQAMEGRFLFDNRFAVDAQPGLTIHLYFLVLGWIAKLVSIPVASTLARLGFTFLFVILLGRLLCKLNLGIFACKFALILATFGAGLGYLQWSPFGRAVETGQEGLINGPLQGRLPIDVWQPEAFVFPSMLTNGLFMVSLCLILGVLLSLIGAKTSWKPVLPGFLCMFALMNIHSYDVLLLALVLVGFLVATWRSGGMDVDWLKRSGVIACGAVLPALWFVYVLQNDPVFRARAATETFSPTFRQILFGIVPGLLITLGAFFYKRKPTKLEIGGIGLFLSVVVALFVVSDGINPDKYFLTLPSFLVLYVLMLGVLGLMARKDDSWNLFWAWAVIGLIAPYFPGLFQRKLAMGLALPWGVVAAVGVAALTEQVDRAKRNLVSALVLVVASASSFYWFQRELQLIQNNVATTTVQPVFYGHDVEQIVRYLESIPGRKVATAFPGIPNKQTEGFLFGPPLVADLNPLLSGLAGAYTYAGHWSETPDYANRRAEVQAMYTGRMTDDERLALANAMNVDFIVVPDGEAYSGLQLPSYAALGEKVYDGPTFDLIKVLKQN